MGLQVNYHFLSAIFVFQFSPFFNLFHFSILSDFQRLIFSISNFFNCDVFPRIFILFFFSFNFLFFQFLVFCFVYIFFKNFRKKEFLVFIWQFSVFCFVFISFQTTFFPLPFSNFAINFVQI